MDKYTENRFGYLKEKSLDELIVLREQVVEELNYLLGVVNKKNVSSEQKSEIVNSDLKFAREELNYIEDLITQRGHKRSI